LKNFYRSHLSKWPPQYCKYSTLSDIITIWNDNVELLQYCGGHFENGDQ
jgi:hypothetical protein